MACSGCLFIPRLHSDFIRLREEEGGKEGIQEGVDGGIERERERENRQLVLNHHRREMGCREMGGAEGKKSIRMNKRERALLKSCLTLRVSRCPEETSDCVLCQRLDKCTRLAL